MSIEVYQHEADYDEFEYVDEQQEQRRKDAVELLVEERSKGLNWKQIESQHGIPAAQAATLVNDYLHENYSLANAQQMRMLQVQRLEKITTALWEQVMQGDILTQGKQTSNLLATLNQLTNLLDLNKSSLVDAQVELTKAQTQMARDLLVSVRSDMLQFVDDKLAKLPRSLDMVNRIRREITDGWAGAFHEASEKAVGENRVRRAKKGRSGGPA